MHELEESEKKLQAYAYLTATLNRDSSLQDVLDCITPFMKAVIQDAPDKPINSEDLHEDLKKYGLEIPYYALEQLLPRLQNRGFIEWNQALKTFVPSPSLQQHDAEIIRLQDDFGDLETKISEFAENISRRMNMELGKPTIFDTWCDALINTLKQNFSNVDPKAVKMDGSIVFNSGDIEHFVVSRFITEAQERDSDLFNRIVRVYSGILIEEFISNIQSIGVGNDINGLVLYYDTTVILRLLGTSGRLLQNATLDMHNTLQSLGAKTYIISNTFAEVTRIIESLRIRYQRGLEIHGETSDAIHDGEISIAEIADLENTAEARLAQINVFPFQYDYASRKNEDMFQISLTSFSERLKYEAQKRERGYKLESANSDAEVLAIILRMRKGKAASRLSAARYLFVSSNSLLQRTARMYAVEETDHYDQSSIPPILTVGQMTTAAWLSYGRKFEPQKVSQELLASCYSAVQPDSEWADEFGNALDKFRDENPEYVQELSDASLIFSGVRNIARDETLNQPIALKRVNLAELIREEAERIESRKAEELKEVSDSADSLGRSKQREAQKSRFLQIADKIAAGVVFALKFGIILGFALAFYLLNSGSLASISPVLKYSLTTLVGLLSVLSIADTFGFPFAKKFLNRIRSEVAQLVFRYLLSPLLTK